MFFNDTEIFRTSTAEPIQNGIIWTYIKDMSHVLSLFKEHQKIIFDLGNLVDDTYTGSWNTVLTATFFEVEDSFDAADVVIPVSSRKSSVGSPSTFVIPESRAVDALSFPQNIERASFSISACGQANEEFWWSNVLSSDTHVFGNDTTLSGHSPFREVQLMIDGMLAGVAWPFPVIFTGGIAPGLWRPVVGIDAFDLREDEIDITPFAPLLADGKEHTFEIKVAGISDDGNGGGNLTFAIGSNWVVTGKVFIWLDKNGSVTTGTAPEISSPAPSLQLYSATSAGVNRSAESLRYSVYATRNLSIQATVGTSRGSQLVTWQQTLKYSNEGDITNGGNNQTNLQSTSGSDVASSGYSKAFSYPLYVFSSYRVLDGGNYTIDGKMSRGKSVDRISDLAFPSELTTFGGAPKHMSSYVGTSASDWQNGTASHLGAPALKTSIASGSTEQWFFLYGVGDSATVIQEANPTLSAPSITELYRRHVLAANDSIIRDEESFTGSMGQEIHEVQQDQSSHSSAATAQPLGRPGIRAMLGRGPA
jgi:hypothetical protein